MENLTERFANHPRQLLLVDCAGALFSAFMLGVVLVHWQAFFGIPKTALYILAIFPCFFAAFDLFFYFSKSFSAYKALRVMALFNRSYCLFSLVLALFHASVIQIPGWFYLLGEVVIVFALALFEMKISAAVKSVF